jgi:hypothetical protein
LPDDQNDNSAAPDGSPADEPAAQYVTEEQLSRAVAARLTDYSKKQEKAQAAFESRLLQAVSEARDPASDDSGVREEQDPKSAADETPAVRALQRQLADVSQRLEKSAAEVESERAKARHQSMVGALQDALASAGLDTPVMRHAVGYLVDTSKRVRMDDDDSVLFLDEAGGELPLKEGVTAWARSDDAKPYLPPRGASGSGSPPAGRRPSRVVDPRERARELLQRSVLGDD